MTNETMWTAELHRDWGENVRTARPFTQERLAELVGVDQSLISRIERGLTCPSDELKYRIAGALGKKVSDLFPAPAFRPPFPEAVA